MPRYDSVSGTCKLEAYKNMGEDGKEIQEDMNSLPFRLTPFVESAENLSEYENYVLATSADLREFCDYMRMTSDTLSSRLSNITSIISLVNNEMQQSFTAATNVLGKLGETWKRTLPQ
jgi:hypothetical protein